MNVTVYSMATCGPCKMLHPAFKNAGIEYTKVDITADTDAARKNGIRGVPTTIIISDKGEEVARIVGFDPKVLAQVKEVLKIG